MTTKRVAVLVVHGIADQLPGQTAREVARLLCRRGDGSPPYVQGEMQQVLLPVEKLEPGAANPPRSAARPTPGAPSGFYQAQRAPAAEAEPQSPDLGIALNDYLLGRLVMPERDALYESTRVSLRGSADDRPVDVYEMYWADLSRLGTGGIRALSSLYQLFFHLSTLAADVVDQAALGRDGGAGWQVLQRLHGWLAWLMKAPAAVFQLAMLLMVVFGAAALVAPELQAQLLAVVFGLGSFVLLSLTVLTWLRKPRGIARAARLVVLIAAAAASLATAIVAASSERLMPTLYFGASAVGAGLLGAWLVERYAGVTLGVRLLGHLVVVATVVMLCVDGKWQLPYVTTQQEWMLVAALNVGEWLLAGVLLVWTAFVTVQTVALSLGLWLGRGADDATRASLATARVALVGSSGLFVVLSLVLWSVIGVVTTNALNDLLYEPVVFGEGYRSAALFIDERVKSLGAFFTPLVVAFTLLGAAALLVLLPSLIEEISPASNLDANGVRKGAAEWARNLGRWLAGGLRALQKASTDIVPVGAIAGSVFFLAFVVEQFAFTAGLGGDIVARLAGYLAIFEGETLVAAGKWLAGGALTIVALGSRFTQTIGRLRVAIDAVLDIDNYFADPPNRQPPRARIYSRYVSVLAYLREAGYGRVVIVAHSQGTVISADLLRYLHVHRRLEGVVGNMRLALVTVGSPLRDLYAAYFPLLYKWMGSRAAGFEKAEPAATDLGVTEWVNACRSGDYVGRFVWTTDRDPRYFDVAIVGRDGTVEARRAGDRTEFCLGAGGHTHYFSDDAVALAAEIERLVGR